MQEKIQTFCVINVALILRWCVTYHPYSGEGQPPMYGDYEAQRHWQEITVNLPIEEWYKNSTDNNLDYWGLDYPPLTAYHSFLLGKIAQKIDSKYITLHDSRGFESFDHKLFMRLTVFLADLFICLPAILYFIFTFIEKKIKEETNLIYQFSTRVSLLAVILFYPGLILIDYGHFQYNSISLGLFVAGLGSILNNSLNLGSFLFILALNYKQMELYHALPFFVYILGTNTPINKRLISKCLLNLFYVTFTVIVTFLLVWFPFIWNSRTFFSVIMRLFPLARGVFEDKVANFWCTINVVIKLRDIFDNIHLAQICLITTTIALLPSCLDMYFRPSKQKFIISQINSSLAFFLFSYQVHEKSILLAAIPVALYFQYEPFACFWFLLISSFSMIPLIIKDGLLIAFFALTIFFSVSISWLWFTESYFLNDSNINYNNEEQNSKLKKEKSKGKALSKKSKLKNQKEKETKVTLKESLISIVCNKRLIIILFYLSISGFVLLTFCCKFMKPRKIYPDLFPLLLSVYSCGHFILFCLYFNYRQFTLKTRQGKLKFN
ncbi:dolichyl pyrophosphate Man9GlcNAc2 alpha-1,3-glucosyltransferase [Leptopilina boulardi]|uniref:dolichyl pyrophosphate Man9GlcNAc2 alpha-1,3-glucosyltransferase n=1 Tax=Leptopilina boulardi TaxID=63433 RepID=UPI0021F62D6F|nr:dolichyl pyrophosphate Man9GlcNAc2 alpha-1,3-glucosyltransferase [Leptopilina boulardi]